MINLIDIKDFSVEEINELIDVAKDMMKCPEMYSEKCKEKEEFSNLIFFYFANLNKKYFYYLVFCLQNLTKH